MLNLLNAVSAFGKVQDWNLNTTIAVLVVAQVLILAAAVVLVIYLLKKRKANKTDEPMDERMLTGISLDLGVVKREFILGEEFDCEGLIIRAKYNTKPITESYTDYTVVDGEGYVKLESSNQLVGIYVIMPEMNEVGKKDVFIKFANQSDVYSIEVSEAQEQPAEEQPVEEQPVEEQPAEEQPTEKPVEEQPAEQPANPNALVAGDNGQIIIEEESLETVLRYDRSFTARLIQSEDDAKQWYSDIKNELLAHRDVHDRMSWKYETFRCHKEVVAKLAFRGKTMCIFLPLNFADYVENTLVEDASDTAAYEETPVMVRLKSKRRVNLAMELIGIVLEQREIKRKTKFEAVDYYLPYEGIVELMNKGLAKRNVRTSEEEAIFDKDKMEAQDEDDGGYQLEQVAPGVYVTKKN